MLEYLIIMLDDTSVSYCHYDNRRTERRLMRQEDLKAGITWAMKENLAVQFVYPSYELPEAYKGIIESVEHSNIQPALHADGATDVAVFDNWDDFMQYDFRPDTIYVLRTGKKDFFDKYGVISKALARVMRLHVMMTDVVTFSGEDFRKYQWVLERLSEAIGELYRQGKEAKLNLLTDRTMLDAMNNCNAGWKNITLAPNGKFYLCPAFYLEDEADDVGSLADGLRLKNAHLYNIEYAPLCRRCDAYQCKRCIWLNRKTTLEVNVPSHEQCVAAHLERNASRSLLAEISRYGSCPEGNEIKEIDYLDPIEICK